MEDICLFNPLPWYAKENFRGNVAMGEGSRRQKEGTAECESEENGRINDIKQLKG